MLETSTELASQRLVSRDTDEQLMSAFSAGSMEAFDELFTRYKQPLFGYFYRRLAEPTHAEELTQEVFMVILRRSSRYKVEALFRTYLYSIGSKILRANRRKAAFRAMFYGAAPAEHKSAARNTIEVETIVRQAIGKLSPIDREILLLREFEQLNYSEIASVLHLPVNTVRSRLFRARMALRDLLEPASSSRVSTESEERR